VREQGIELPGGETEQKKVDIRFDKNDSRVGKFAGVEFGKIGEGETGENATCRGKCGAFGPVGR